MKSISLLLILSLSTFAHAAASPDQKVWCAQAAIQKVLGSNDSLIADSMLFRPTSYVARPLVQRGLGSLSEDEISFKVKAKTTENILSGVIFMSSEIVADMYDPGTLTVNKTMVKDQTGNRILCHLATESEAERNLDQDERELKVQDLDLK